MTGPHLAGLTGQTPHSTPHRRKVFGDLRAIQPSRAGRT